MNSHVPKTAGCSSGLCGRTCALYWTNDVRCAAFAWHCAQVCETLKDLDFEIIVVDDGSADRTWDILQEIQARLPECRPVRNVGEHGFGRAIIFGFSHVLGDAVVIMMTASCRVIPSNSQRVYKPVKAATRPRSRR